MSELRQLLIDTACRMLAENLCKGTAGNLSIRAEEDGEKGYLITPTGIPYNELVLDDIVFMCFSEKTPANKREPSSEWRFHQDIYANRPEANAIVHAHSPFATGIACTRKNIPPFHYMIARFGGDSVRCAQYETFGTQELSNAALKALKNRNACLLANHGQLVFGKNVKHALGLAVELEELCRQYWLACQFGTPVLLKPKEMRVVQKKFDHYGQQ